MFCVGRAYPFIFWVFTIRDFRSLFQDVMLVSLLTSTFPPIPKHDSKAKSYGFFGHTCHHLVAYRVEVLGSGV